MQTSFDEVRRVNVANIYQELTLNVFSKKNRTAHEFVEMLKNCYQDNLRAYHREGGCGIKVCDRWHQYQNFLQDMGNAQEDESLMRIKRNGNYAKDNCVWMTGKEIVETMQCVTDSEMMVWLSRNYKRYER